MTTEVAVKTIPVAEIFGPTLQGEGALAGMPTYFLRVGGCDFGCNWCDSDHAVNADKVRLLDRMSQLEIMVELNLRVAQHPGPRWLTISGGNPALYDLDGIVEGWQAGRHESGWARMVAVETQGSRWKPWLGKVNLLTLSPKAPSSGMNIGQVYPFIEAAGDAFNYWRAKAAATGEDPNERKLVLKVVVFDEEDYQFARDLHIRYPLIPFYLSCGTAMGGLSGRWVPPPIPEQEFDFFKGVRTSPDLNWSPRTYVDSNYNLLNRYRWLAERVMRDDLMSDVAAFPQMHCLIWGIETRGV